MESFDTNARIYEVLKGIDQLNKRMDRIIEVVNPNEDLWDNADIIRNWKVSERTVATWRQNGLMSFIKVNGKIWYPKKAREEFLQKHLKGSIYGR